MDCFALYLYLLELLRMQGFEKALGKRMPMEITTKSKRLDQSR